MSARRSTADNGWGSQAWQRVIRPVNSELTAKGYAPLNEDQLGCLIDSKRMREAVEMTCHLEQRCDVHPSAIDALLKQIAQHTADAVRAADMKRLVSLHNAWELDGDPIGFETLVEMRAELIACIEQWTNVVQS